MVYIFSVATNAVSVGLTHLEYKMVGIESKHDRFCHGSNGGGSGKKTYLIIIQSPNSRMMQQDVPGRCQCLTPLADLPDQSIQKRPGTGGRKARICTEDTSDELPWSSRLASAVYFMILTRSDG